MSDKDLVIRFVTTDSATSRIIRFQEGVCVPFTPSHVEALSRDEQHYTGAHIDGGVMARPIGYDKDSPNVQEKLVRIPVSDKQFDDFHNLLESHIGEPYDWQAIFSFGVPNINVHAGFHAICSALMYLLLRGIEFFPWPSTVPAHHISPRDLFLILSTHVEIDH